MHIRRAFAVWEVSADFADERRFCFCCVGVSRDQKSAKLKRSAERPRFWGRLARVGARRRPWRRRSAKPRRREASRPRSSDGLLLRGRYPQISQITADFLLLRALAAYMPHAKTRRREASQPRSSCEVVSRQAREEREAFAAWDFCSVPVRAYCAPASA